MTRHELLTNRIVASHVYAWLSVQHNGDRDIERRFPVGGCCVEGDRVLICFSEWGKYAWISVTQYLKAIEEIRAWNRASNRVEAIAA